MTPRWLQRFSGWLSPEPPERVVGVVRIVPLRCVSCYQPLRDGEHVVTNYKGETSHLICPPPTAPVEANE